MNTRSFVMCFFVGACLAAPAVVRIKAAEVAVAHEAANPALEEVAVVTRAHDAALKDDAAGADAQLASASRFTSGLAPSVVLARRAVEVCGWLQNENHYGRAMKVAQRAVKRLSSMREDNDADRAERLYWEALLQGHMLDEKVQAIALLDQARALRPDDDRILDLNLELSAAVAEFGR
jgi:hypothetical protein